MKRKIKILEAIRQGKIGGGESHVLELCSNLDKDIYEPVVLSFTDGPMVKELKARGIRTKVIHTEKPFNFFIWGEVKKFMEQEKFDIAHAHGTRAMSNIFNSARSLSIPLIYTVHGWSFHQNQKYPVRRLRELSEKFLTSRADKTVCVSKSNQKDGVERFNMQRSTVIYNAIDTQKFNLHAQKFADIRDELIIDRDKTVVGFIARITEQKDPVTMIKAFEIIKKKTDDIILLMVGDGDLKNETISLANELNLQSHIKFLPFRTDVPDILNAIDIYALPSLWEGFPIGILEAMAMKKSVVASPVDGTRELIEDGHSGLFAEIKNSQKLADAILLLHYNKELKNKIALNGYNEVSRKYTIEKQVKKVGQLYNEVLYACCTPVVSKAENRNIAV